MPKRPARSHFPVSLYATPNPAHRDIFYTVLRAGHLVGGPDHHIRRDHFPGHELLLSLKGRGFVRVGGREHAVREGEFVWINCHHPHEHGAAKEDPWELYWLRIEGPRLSQMCDILSIIASPVFEHLDHHTAATSYEHIFRLIRSNAPEAPALIHAEVARLIALAFVARQHSGGLTAPDVPAPLRKVIERMALSYFQPHRVAQLAGIAGMSASHFSRVFKAAFGTSPIDWLRRERINQAKRRLAETSDDIKQIAEQVGYGDRFYFSKDFKQLTGLTPRDFRRRETLDRGA